MFVAFIALIAFAIPFLSKKVSTSSTLLSAVFSVLLVRQMISFAQVFYHGLPTVKGDAINFHEFCALGIGSLSREPYGVFLKSAYGLFGPSHLLGCELSQIAFSIAIVIEIELIYFFGLAKYAPRLVLLFGLLPSCLLNTSVTSREAYQVVAFLMLSYSSVHTMRYGITIFSTILGPLSLVMLVMLQQGFALLVLILAPFCLFLIGTKRPGLLIACTALFGIILLTNWDLLWNTLTSRSLVLSRISEGQGLEYIDGYQDSVERGRSDFDTFLDLSSLGGFTRTAPTVMLNYWFSPLPWQVSSLLDLYGLGESLIRAVLVLGLTLSFRKVPKSRKHELLMLLGLYLLVELMWTAGTSNWGTAFRHRVVGYGLLVILGSIGLTRPDFETEEKSNNLSPRAKLRKRRSRASYY